MNSFSIVMPIERNRIPLLNKTLERYKEQLCNGEYQFIFVTRSIESISEIDTTNLHARCDLIRYTHEGIFNPAKALNLGVKNSIYNNIIITCPEVKPITSVINQLHLLPEGNYICQVYDQNEDGSTGISLVNSHFRGYSPAMYFLAVFQREDIEKINGWDLDYMFGKAYEDDDFGYRFNLAGLKFEVRDDIVALHQYHPRVQADSNWHRNGTLFEEKKRLNKYYCERGLREV